MALSTPHARPWSPARVPYRPLLIGLAVVVGLGGTYVAVAGNPFGRNQQAVTFDTALISQGRLQLSVAATGPVTNPVSVPLSFNSSGKLSEVDVGVGQRVTAGQTLARLDSTDLQAAVDQAQATLNQQQANLAKVAAGATPEQAALAQAQISAAQTTFDGAQKSLQAAQGTSSTAVAAAQADIGASQVSLGSSQNTLQGTQDQADAALQADQTALANA
ncbi:MAG: biotin/lipoyl-binding protein, partial [Chloroflexi bacterium]